MKELNFYGSIENAPSVVTDIAENNITKLDSLLGKNINKEIQLSQYCSATPLYIALASRAFDSLRWLVDHGAELNTSKNPVMNFAVRFCGEEEILYLFNHGANLDIITEFGDVYEQALAEKRFELLPLINKLGHSVERFGGEAFRSTVFKCVAYDKDQYHIYLPAVEFFLENGVDVNYHKPDMVFSDGKTSLHISAECGNFDMCKLLIEHGADVKIENQFGVRPYTAAIQALSRIDKAEIDKRKSLSKIAEYIKSLEPTEFHSTQNKLKSLTNFKMPQSLIAFLQGNHLKFEFPDNQDCSFIEFFHILDTVEIKIKNQKYLQLVKVVDNYDVLILWNSKTKKIAFYDFEHELLRDVTDFDEFIGNVESYLMKIINGDYD